jgi:hypothetical protein
MQGTHGGGPRPPVRISFSRERLEAPGGTLPGGNASADAQSLRLGLAHGVFFAAKRSIDAPSPREQIVHGAPRKEVP